jgi:hypothetical protein
MANPKKADLIRDEKISRYDITADTSLKYKTNPVPLMLFTITKEPNSAMMSAKTTRIGSMSVVAITRDTIRYENGRVPETSIASICSVTFILDNSAPILDPNFPAQIRPVISGPNDLTTACETSDGNQDSAPNDAREGLDCFVKTIPAKKEVNEIRNNDLFPKEKHCLSISLISYGGISAPLKKSRIKE